ncbi:MAG: hypothetical protein V2B14_04380 [bacterium]
MKCTECERELKEDSKFCDWCGNIVPHDSKPPEVSLNTSVLLAGILFSIFITLLVMLLAKAFGLSLLFGGLFLPFLWLKKR